MAHFVASLKPATIFADELLQKVYYALGANIYAFDSGAAPLPTQLTIPEQLCGTPGVKEFIGFYAELADNPVNYQFTMDRNPVAGLFTLTPGMREVNLATCPEGTVGNQLGIVITSEEDFCIFLPIEIEHEAPA